MANLPILCYCKSPKISRTLGLFLKDMLRLLSLIGVVVLYTSSILGQTYSIQGNVLSSRTNEPISNAIVTLLDYDVWAITDEKGHFFINNIPSGILTIRMSNLGYVAQEFEIILKKNVSGLTFHLKEDNLTLNEVVVTAQRRADEATTSYLISRTMLDHAQILDVANISSLLPGESTNGANNLTVAQRFSLRSGGTAEMGNPTLGTIVSVDGVQLSSNATMNDISNVSNHRGIDTRSIGTSNIESVEVITGVPSVEYGDMSNGIVKINTRSGKTPLLIDLITEPNTKQYALSKGFDLGVNNGILNTNIEHTQSISDLASPYTTYARNILSLTYANTFNKQIGQPIVLKVGLTGNIGGYDSKSDPDYYQDTYNKQRDNVLRGFLDVNWMINKPWLTSIVASASVNYNDRLNKENKYNNSAVPTAVLHGKEEGYFIGTGTYADNPNAEIILRPGGNWYELSIIDNKYLDYTAKIKANWAKKFGQLNNKIVLGIDYKRSENKGRGTYYDDMNVAPTWRGYRYDKLPAMNNLSLYAQEQINIPIENTFLQVTAGLRSEITMISGSEYGTVSSFSPRFNLRYNIPVNSSLVKNLAIRAGIGETVKLPTFSVLYPQTSYKDIIIFNETNAKGYYIIPTDPEYNPNLKWQKERLQEIGLDLKMKGVSISLSFYNNKTIDPYVNNTSYSPFSYNFTDHAQLESSAIPSGNRVFSIDQNTGQVIVSDKTGTYPSEQLTYVETKTFKTNSTRENGSPILRRGLEWVFDFDKISALSTSFRLDGKYYYYKGIDETLYQNLNTTWKEYPYIAHYVGSTNSTYNGSIVKKLNTNLTITTHIPKIRLIVSLRVESSLYNYKQNISEYEGKTMAFVVDKNDLSTNLGGDIYAGNQYAAVFPLYYTSYDDPNTKIPFAEKLAWAKINDINLYNNLYRLINVTTNDYTFVSNKLSAYFSANLSVTKEVGKYASISFTAKNFLNSMAKVKNSNTNAESSLYGSGYIPSFYYGLSLRIKI